MIDILIKLDAQHTIFVLKNGDIKLFPKPISVVMNEYLKNLFSNYNLALLSGKCVNSSLKYKSPMTFYSKDGINILIPINSVKSDFCCFVSIEYCLNNTRDDFFNLTGIKLSHYQWGKMIQIGIEYAKMFNLELSMPYVFQEINKTELKKLLSRNTI